MTLSRKQLVAVRAERIGKITSN